MSRKMNIIVAQQHQCSIQARRDSTQRYDGGEPPAKVKRQRSKVPGPGRNSDLSLRESRILA